MSDYQKQELLPEEVRNRILEKIMMLKSWFYENLDIELSIVEYNYISEALLKQCGLPYSNRDLFDVQLWALRVPHLPGKWAREKSNFDENIIEFMKSVGLSWEFWITYKKS